MRINTSIAVFTSALLFDQPSSVLGQSGLFTQLLNAFLQPVVQGVCATTQTELGLDGTLDCTCNATSLGLFKGVDGTITCSLPEPRCFLPPNLYCADGTIDVTVAGGLFTQTAIEADITGCFQVDSGLPGGIASIDDICFNFVPSGLSLQSCTATIGGVACQACTICDSGIDFTFDCSNIDILPGALRLPGPKITTCLGLSLIPTNTTA
jgi:hypothetical protein